MAGLQPWDRLYARFFGTTSSSPARPAPRNTSPQVSATVSARGSSHLSHSASQRGCQGAQSDAQRRQRRQRGEGAGEHRAGFYALVEQWKQSAGGVGGSGETRVNARLAVQARALGKGKAAAQMWPSHTVAHELLHPRSIPYQAYLSTVTIQDVASLLSTTNALGKVAQSAAGHSSMRWLVLSQPACGIQVVLFTAPSGKPVRQGGPRDSRQNNRRQRQTEWSCRDEEQLLHIGLAGGRFCWLEGSRCSSVGSKARSRLWGAKETDGNRGGQ